MSKQTSCEFPGFNEAWGPALTVKMKTPYFVCVEIKNQKELPGILFTDYNKAKLWADKKGTYRMLYCKRLVRATDIHPDHLDGSGAKWYMETSLCYCGGDDRIRRECEKPNYR